MAWFSGNDPTGARLSAMGRVMSEILYSINELEIVMGYTATAWTDVGAFPAVNAFDGKRLSEMGPWIIEARALFDTAPVVAAKSVLANIKASGTNYYALDGGLTRWTFANIYNAAMGVGVDWVTADIDLVDLPLANPVAFEELLKICEEFENFEYSTVVPGLSAVSDLDSEEFNSLETGIAEATTDDAFAEMVAAFPGGGALTEHWRVFYNAGPDTYSAYAGFPPSIRIKTSEAPSKANPSASKSSVLLYVFALLISSLLSCAPAGTLNEVSVPSHSSSSLLRA